jgi:hypothetical protein
LGVNRLTFAIAVWYNGANAKAKGEHMNDLTYLPSQLPATKAQLDELAASLADRLTEWNDPLDAYVGIYRLEYLAAALREKMASHVVLDGGSASTKDGAKVTVRNGYAQYDFGQDSTWAELKRVEAEIAASRKDREAFLKTLREPVADMTTGEIIRPAEIKGFTKSTLAVTLPK